MTDQDYGQAALAHAENEVEHLTRLLDAESRGRLVHDRDPLRPFAPPCTPAPPPPPAGEILDRLAQGLDADLQLLEVARGFPPHRPFREHAKGEAERAA